MNTHTIKTLSGLLTGVLLLVSLPSAAQQSACLNDSADKVCMQLTAQPDSVVQASKLDGQTDTYVSYTARVTGITNPTSSRRVAVTFTLSSAVAISSFVHPATGSCSISGASLTCQFDKHVSVGTETISFLAKAPTYAGAATPSVLTNTAVFGWGGRTNTVSKSLTVSQAGGYTWVPPNTTVSLVTAPENTDPASQTTAANPVWAKMTIPGRSTGFLAYLALNNNTDEDLAMSCSGGLFFSGNSDGGPYVCRDIGAPYDAGVGARWVASSIDDSVEGTFGATPVQMTMIWDESVVPAAQLTQPAPPFAIFYHAQEAQGAPMTHPIRAFSKPCGLNAPPCVSGVQKYSTGDWTATLELSDFYNTDAAGPALLTVALNSINAVLNEILGTADAGLAPPIITK